MSHSDNDEIIKYDYDDDDQEGFDLEYSTHAEKRKNHKTNQFVSKIKSGMVLRSVSGRKASHKRGRQSL